MSIAVLQGNGSLSSSIGLDLSTGSVSPTPSADSSHDGTSGTGTGAAGIPQLNESQIESIVLSASALAADLPEYELKPLNMKKEFNKELMQVSLLFVAAFLECRTHAG